MSVQKRPTEARVHWRGMRMGFLTGDLEEKSLAEALEAAAAVGKA
ncbi:MAG: hypothetical protein P8R42_10760 [Candidatus Binatia bacterium]|nr:hypothetical protein [Candidatus Binatia bacterium]